MLALEHFGQRNRICNGRTADCLERDLPPVHCGAYHRVEITTVFFMVRTMAEESLTPGELLREAIADGAIQAPGAPNALMGKLIEEMGFSAMYLSGAAFSAGVLGLPDIGLFSLTELVQQVSYLTARVGIPVIVDADTGFGETANVERTIVELERAGAAAIQLEDQELPKRCGHLSGKSLVSTEIMSAKLRAAAAAR